MTSYPIDPQNFEYRPLAEYSTRLPSSRPGKRLHRSTLYRWATRGTPGAGRLQTVRIGGGRYTCDAWVAEFIAASGSDDSANAVAEPLPDDAAERIRRRFGVG